MSVRGPVSLHPTAFVAPGAVVLGDVRLEARASVWFNTVIRGDSDKVVVGEDTNVQDNSVVHEDEGFPTLIGARVTIGHRAVIHGCVIEDDCLIGMGSVILSGARIGTGSLVGASSLVREHQSIPPGSLAVGSPARVMGPTTDVHRGAIRNGSTHYAELARFYMMRGLACGANREGEVTGQHAPMTAQEWGELVSRFRAGAWRDASRAGPEDVPPEALLEMASQDLARLPVVDAALRESSLPVMHAAPQKGKGEARASSQQAREAWLRARGDLVARLESLGPRDWIRPIGHPTRGARTIGDWLREWVDQDFERAFDLAQAREDRS